MLSIYIIFFFLILGIIKVILFDNLELTINNSKNNSNINNEIITNKKYLPQNIYITYIWILIFTILIYYYIKVDTKKDKKYIIRFTILLLISLCFLYETFTKEKTLRYIKFYNYFIFILLIFLYLIMKNKTHGNILFIIPIFLWITYIIILNLLDEFNIIHLYKDIKE